jgi:23S rRNA (uridine2479-2'-O)-methyltransferase
VTGVLRITSRNARFQQWQALLTSRAKRQQLGEFLVQGVRPISVAAEAGWRFRALIYDADRLLSGWAQAMLRSADTVRVAMSADLVAELGEKDADRPELLAVVEMPPDDMARIEVGRDFLGLVLDRPGRPGNLGSIVRSADAFGAAGVVITGHAADPYDPRSVRASTGSLFTRPVVRLDSPRELTAWLAAQRTRGYPIALVGADEGGHHDVFDIDLTVPALLVMGNETAGLSAAWREQCDYLVRIPMTGSASSLNVANAATVVLYEAARQRILASR